jgi:hypothetical protein
MYRRIAFAAAGLSLAVGGMLMVWVFLRPHADVQRLYGVFLGFAGLLVGGVLLVGAMSIPASAGQMTWRELRPRWPGDRSRLGHRVGHRWGRHGRGGGDHQPRPPIRARARVRPPTRSRYGAPPAAMTALALASGEGEAGSPVP